MYTMAEINRIRNSARMLDMEARWDFWSLSGRRLSEICNGYGPDRWTEKERRVLTAIYRHYPEVAAIHDVDFEFSDGTEAGFLTANRRFRKNFGRKLAYRYPAYAVWLYPARAWAWIKIRLACRAVGGDGGRNAWRAAYARRATQ